MRHRSNVNRRHFFRSLLREVGIAADELGGIPQLCLDDLVKYPDHVLADIRPVLAPGLEFAEDDTTLRVRWRGRQETLVSFDWDPVTTFVIGRLNGTGTVQDISCAVDEVFERGEQASFAQVREVFLNLALCGACRPDRPILE